MTLFKKTRRFVSDCIISTQVQDQLQLNSIYMLKDHSAFDDRNADDGQLLYKGDTTIIQIQK